MSGFSTNIINLITDNLRDRYQSGFPIIKELIQNADDAEAKRFVFGEHPGFSNSTHPLLQGPGLFFYNNGGFKASDKRAITSFAENAKAAEEGTIGKFGLGMKSVFHLCEAFFYVAKGEAYIYREILNPWNSPDQNLHSDWDNVAEIDWKYLEQVANEIADRDDKWFFLWLPLRERSHLKNEHGEDTGAIIDRFPVNDGIFSQDISFLRDESLANRLAVFLPLLSYLSNIEFRSFLSADLNFNLHLESEERLGCKVSYPFATGKVVAENRSPLLFHGHKQVASEGSIFSLLKTHAKWPKTYSRDETGHLRPTPDKSKPEGSVLINHNDHKTGSLSIQWALFLPLDDETHLYETANTQSSHHYSFIIHGQFFVEAGRRSIYAFRHLHEPIQGEIDGLDEAGLRKRWNQELARQVVLPMFLPTLNEYVQKCGLNDSEISALTKAIGDAISDGGAQGSQIFLETFKSTICAKHSWLRLLKQSGSTWRLVSLSETTQILPLPTPRKSEPDRPWKVLPGLGDLERETLFVDANAPNISRSLDRWREDKLLNVLGSVTPDVFLHSGLLGYLEEFITCTANEHRSTEKLQKVLIQLVRQGFRHTPLDILRQNRTLVSSIIDFIEPRNRLPLGPQEHTAGSAIPERIFLLLWGCNTNVLLVPKDLDSQKHPGDAKLQSDDVLSLMKVIHDQLQRPDIPLQERYLQIARQLLEKLDEIDRFRLLQTNQDLMIISAFDARSSRDVPVSFRMLDEARERNNLFGFAQGTTPQQRAGLSLQLSAVIPDEPIFLIRVDTFRTLFGNESLSSASEERAILRSLGISIKALGPEIARRTLIQHAHNLGQDTIARRGLRYLLHGNEDHYLNDDAALWVARHQQSTAWEKLWRQVSGIEGQGAWNVLKRGLAENLPQARWGLLGIREIEPSQVIEELRRIGTSCINPEVFSNTECEEILSFVTEKQLWKDLPLHVFCDGGKGDVRDGVYLDVGLDLLPELQGGIRIITRSDNHQMTEKQRKWIPPLDEVAMVTITLNAQDPGRYWRFIADTLLKFSSEKIVTVHTLRETAWLPLRNGSFIRPFDVIDLQPLKSQIQILAARAHYCFASEADLDDEIQNHPVMPILKSACFATGKDALSRLGLLMAELSDYSIGEVDIPEESLLSKMLPALAQIQALPAWCIVEEVEKEFGLSTCIDYLFPKIQRHIPIDTLIQILNALANDAEKQVQGAEDAFVLYLKLYGKDQSDAKERVSEIKLRSKTGDWKFAEDLCFGAADVCDGVLLDDDQAKILDSVIVDAGQYDEANLIDTSSMTTDPTLQESPNILEEYFSKWKGLVQDELIGALLCLLGHAYLDLAKLYLGTHSVEWIIDQIPWKSPTIIDSSGRREWVKKRTPIIVRESLSVVAQIINEDQVTVRSLTGKILRVPLSREFNTIIAGSLNWKEEYLCYLPIRGISPSIYPAEKLSFLLKQTFGHLLDKIYYQLDPNLDGLWQELEKSDQLEIEVARRVILNHLPFYLRQLNVHHHSKELHKALDEYDQALQHLEEEKLRPSITEPNKEEKLTRELDKQRGRLADIFAENESAQKAVLEALRQKLKDYQYDVQSIPFELFQNADDAAVELVHLKTDKSGYPVVPEPAKKFVMDVEAGVVRFMHWGRMINSRGPQTTEDESRGFHRDLVNMLVLSSSDKPIDERVTGKFGLGFKSVFLCCNRPCIISGNMRIEIDGGVLPQLWTEAQDAINKLVKFTEDRKYQGTLTELQLERDVRSEDLCVRFETLAGLLCVFGKAIRRIDILDGNREKRFSWDPEALSNGIEVGRCELPLIGGSTCENGIAFRLHEGTIFMALCPTGFVPLAKYIPSVWVTAPTREAESLGFTISAPFYLDAGRGRLSGDTKFNIDLAQKIGNKLGDVLVKLKTDFEKNWEDSKRKLKLTDDTTVAGLWATLWRTLSAAVLSTGETSVGDICRVLVLKAFERLSLNEIPNGLPHPYERMIPLNLVSYELGGLWGRREVIEFLARSGIPVEHCVDADIAKLLKSITYPRVTTKVSFELLLNSIADMHCTEQDASRLGSLACMIWDELSDQERDSALSKMAELKFKSKADQWVEPRFLLCSNIGDKEEELRVPFAPDNALLSDNYGETGRAFFKRCRPRYEASTEIMANWVRLADSEAKRKAVLKYLVNGELGAKLCRQLRERGLTGTWLEQIRENHEYLYDWEPNEKAELLRLLIENISYNFGPPPPPPSLDANRVLNDIYSWWSLEGNEWISKYERRVYPQKYLECLPNLCKDSNVIRGDVGSRKNWLVLLLLGALHTMGRTNLEQHRSFIDISEINGWLDVFASPTRVSENWIRVVEEYLDKQVEESRFYEWMKQFVSIFGISRWLEEYVELFLSINQMHQRFSLDQILRSRASDLFQGGGIEAPPLSRILGIGSCFVIRELVRYGIITNKLAYRYCYVPVGRVRDLLSKLGCYGLDLGINRWEISPQIYNFLKKNLGEEKATFEKTFDLPLLAVAENIDLQYSFLKEPLPERDEETD
jgi:hypothetical protein